MSYIFLFFKRWRRLCHAVAQYVFWRAVPQQSKGFADHGLELADRAVDLDGAVRTYDGDPVDRSRARHQYGAELCACIVLRPGQEAD